MADKNIVTEKPEELTKEEKSDILNIFDKLPEDTFVAVPDDNIVYIGLSGKYIRQLQYLENFILSLIPEDEQETFFLSLRNEFVDKDPDSWTEPEKMYMIIKELSFEIAFQASKQKVDAIYDKSKVGEAVDSMDKPLDPMTEKELKEKLNVN
jgi:hypothetical protein